MAVQQNKKSPSKRGMHRAHNALAKVSLRDKQCAQALGRDHDDLQLTVRTTIDQRGPT